LPAVWSGEAARLPGLPPSISGQGIGVDHGRRRAPGSRTARCLAWSDGTDNSRGLSSAHCCSSLASALYPDIWPCFLWSARLVELLSVPANEDPPRHLGCRRLPSWQGAPLSRGAITKI